MVNNLPNQADAIAKLRSTVERLQDAVQALQQERQRLIEQRCWRLTIIGASLSLLFHVALMIYLSTVHTAGVGGGDRGEIELQFAAVDEIELTDLQELEFDSLSSEVVTFDQAPTFELAELTATVPEVTMAVTTANSLPTLGGSGGGGGEGGLELGGGGGSTSFFGISSKGARFAYIMDISGSMNEGTKLEKAKRELARSVASLPDFAHFYVLLFAATAHRPPMQDDWLRATRPVVNSFIRWLGRVAAGGGTQPRSSFLQVFALETPPDVIFFLTDGEFSDITPEEVASLNNKAKRVVINTIAFGEPKGHEKLKQIARQSGGVFRFVPAEDTP